MSVYFKRLARRSSLCLGAGLAAAAPSALLAQSQSLVLDEIIVSAQKRDQNLQSVPLSITAFSGEAVSRLGFRNSVDIAAQTPGLKIGTPVGEGNNPSITLRGVGLNDFNDNNEGPVAVYIDDVYMASLAGQTFQLFDLDRVEVLRGPQGTLYGRNSTGGLIHFVSRRPTRELEGYVEAGYGDYNDVRLEGAVSGPLGGNLQGRLSASFQDRDGYVENRAGPDRSAADSIALRAMLNADLSDDWSALLIGHWSKSNPIAPGIQSQGTAMLPDGSPCSDASAVAGLCADAFGYRDDDGDPFAGAYNTNGELYIRNAGGALHVKGSLAEAINLTSIASYEKLDKRFEEDTDAGPLDLLRPQFKVDSEQFSQELRLDGVSGRLAWVAGAYYFWQDLSMPQDLIFGADLDPTFYLETLAEQKTKSWAAFGQADIALSDLFTLVAGIRYTDERKTYDYIQIDRLGGVAMTPPGTVLFDFDRASVGDLAIFDKGVVSGKAGLNFTPAEDTLLYASVSRGFKSGGFNAGFTSAPPASIGYSDEQLTAYEAGFKTTLNGRLRVNGAAFYYDYKDLQALTFDGVASFIANADSASVKGGELEVQANPVEGLDIQFGLSYIDAKADSIDTPQGILLDRRLPLAPKFSANGLIRYDFDLGNAGVLTPQIDASYQSAVYFDVANQPVSRQDAYAVWNASLSYRPEGLPNLEARAWIKNAFEKEYAVYTFDFTPLFGFNQKFFGPPRTFGISLRYSY